MRRNEEGLAGTLRPCLRNLLKRGALSIWAYRCVRIPLGLAFVAAGALKFGDLGGFADVIDGFGLLPDPLVPFVALLLPILEVAAGAGLALDIRGSLSVVSGLILLFMGVLAYGIARGLDIDCGCYGPGDAEAMVFGHLQDALYRDLVMACAAAYLFLWRGIRTGRGGSCDREASGLMTKKEQKQCIG